MREGGDAVGLATTLNNLAHLLRQQPARLAEAQRLAEEALTIKQTLDPNAAAIWTTYSILADIAAQQPDSVQSHAYRRLARQAYSAFSGARQQIRQRHGDLIAAVVATVAQPARRVDLDATLVQREQDGWRHLVAAIRRLLDGERDDDTLHAQLNREGSLILDTILGGLADPQGLAALLGDAASVPDDEAAAPSA